MHKELRKHTIYPILMALLLLSACGEERPADSDSGSVPATPLVVELPEWTQHAVYYYASIDPAIKGGVTRNMQQIPQWAQMGVDALCLGPAQALPADSVDAFISLFSLAHSEGMRVLVDYTSGTPWLAGDVVESALLQGLAKGGFKLDGLIVPDRRMDDAGLRKYIVADGLILGSSVAQAKASSAVQGYITASRDVIAMRASAQAASAAHSPEQSGMIELVTLHTGLLPEHKIAGDEERVRAAQAEAVLLFTYTGSPCIGYGQETQSLTLQSGESIDWSQRPYSGFFKRLITLRHENGAMASDEETMTMAVPISAGEGLAYYREGGGESLFVLINPSPEPQTLVLNTESIIGYYEELFTGEELDLDAIYTETIQPWGYRVYEIRH